MTIKTVTYSQSKETMYGYGLKRWDKAGVEIELTESDNPENAFSMAKQLVDEQLSKIIHQKDEMKGTQVRDVLSYINKPHSLIDDIRSCKELTVLESYRIIVKNKPELQQAYDETFKKLSL